MIKKSLYTHIAIFSFISLWESVLQYFASYFNNCPTVTIEKILFQFLFYFLELTITPFTKRR